uniref:Uncharacterized protein n=1 Tax=Strigamia maritima TaxID=126957 RepID=T1IXT6_STRMM
MDYLTLKSNNMDYLSGAAKPTSLDYLSAYATMLDRTRLYFQGLPQLREAMPPPMMTAHGARGERGEIPLDLSMKTIRQTPDSTAADDDVIVLDHKKAAAARAHALSKLHAEAARHGARFSEAYLPQGATFPNAANSGASKKCQHNANLALLGLGAYGGGEMLVPPPHLAGHLGLVGCGADATGGAMCIDFPRCRDLMVPTSLGLHPLHRAQGLQAVPLGGMHALNVQAAYAEQQRNALNKLIPLCPTQNNGAGPMPQDVAGLNELHRLSLAANTGGFLVPPSCVMPMAPSKMVRDRYPMPTPGYPKENACPCCPPTGLPIPCACCIPKQTPATRSGAFTTYGDSCCTSKELPFTSHIQQTLHNSASKEAKDTYKNNKDLRHMKKEMRHSMMVANKNIVKEMAYPKSVTTPPARSTPAMQEVSVAPPSPDGCARTDGRDKHSIQRDAERCRLSLMDAVPITTRVYAPVVSIPTAPTNERTTDAKNPTEATTPKDALLPSGGVAANNEFGVVQCTEGSPSPAKAEEAAAATVRRNTATVWRPGGNWDDEDEAETKAKEAAIPTTVKDKAAPAQIVHGCAIPKSGATFVEELVHKYRKRYAENRALQRLLLSIKRPKPPTCSGAMLTYLMGGAAENKRKRRTDDAGDQERPKKIKSADEECSRLESSIKIFGGVRRHEKRSKDKRLESIRKKRHERIQKIIIKVRDAEEKKKEEEEELDKVEKLIVRLYYGRRRLLGHHRRRPVTDAMRLKRTSLKRMAPMRRNNGNTQQRHHMSKINNPTMVAPVEMKRLMINKTVGETLLHRAARQGYAEVVTYCLTTNYVDVDAKDNAGYTPLHECCARGHLQIARFLLQYGADVNASAAGGIRPIHDAVENDHVQVVRLLLSYGADPLLATYSGLTPIKIAHSRTMIDLLTGFLADVSGDSTDSNSPWIFDGPARFFDSTECGFDIFEDLPSDSEDADENDIMFEISDTPHVRTYLLTTPGCNSPEVFCLLDEVLQKTGQTREELITCYPSARFTSMSSTEFLRMVEQSQVSISVSFNTEEVVHLIKLDDVLRQLLGVETVVISTSEN